MVAKDHYDIAEQSSFVYWSFMDDVSQPRIITVNIVAA